MIETFKNTKPVMSTFSRLRESCRIKTIGASTLQCEDKIFFPFNQEVEVLYYYGINEEKLRQDYLENLQRTLKLAFLARKKHILGFTQHNTNTTTFT
jgi:hypothetical protein